MSGVCCGCLHAQVPCKKCADGTKFVSAEIVGLLDEAGTRLASAAMLLDHCGQERPAETLARLARKIRDELERPVYEAG